MCFVLDLVWARGPTAFLEIFLATFEAQGSCDLGSGVAKAKAQGPSSTPTYRRDHR